MKITINKNELEKNLIIVNKLINKSSHIPILSGFVLEFSDNLLNITGADLENSITANMEIEEIGISFKIAIESARFLDTIKSIGDVEIILNIDIDKGTLNLLTENGEYNFVIEKADDAPVMDFEELDNEIIINSEILKNGIIDTIYAIKIDELRPVMGGIFIKFYDNNIEFCGTDSHRVAIFKENIKNEHNNSFILNLKTAQILKDIIQKDDEICITTNKKNIFFRINNLLLISRKVEGNYPDYDSIIPITFDKKIEINKNSLLSSIKRVGIFANQSSNLVKLEIKNNKLIVSAQDIDFSISANEKINMTENDYDFVIGVKYNYIVDALNSFNVDNLLFSFNTPETAFIINSNNNNNTALIMPLKLN